MTDFIFPKSPPDFKLMDREILENYAANVDFLFREQQSDFTEKGFDLFVLCKAVEDAHPLLKRAGFGPLAGRILAALCEGSKTKRQLYEAMYWDNHEPPLDKIVDVYICKVRRVLAAMGCPIVTLWGVGYDLPERKKLLNIAEVYRRDRILPDINLDTIQDRYLHHSKTADVDSCAIRADILAGFPVKDAAERHHVSYHTAIRVADGLRAKGLI
ncbi:transcriptional regulator [Litorimonas taeanensis]|uniref:Transcriptional regulator n=1 Tax=Litorimonas taeanensis TaxID=568099 RepID=A0A420WD69_9PROT|nr:helix-turn-helix domain-containing protein [Litorimonas taeanensis]RKQ68969.1 transcriptional regulator [Litorimonas taeanensis]